MLAAVRRGRFAGALPGPDRRLPRRPAVLSARPIARRARITRRREAIARSHLLPDGFCGPSRESSTAATSTWRTIAGTWRVYAHQYKLRDGRHDWTRLTHTYVILDRVGNCLAHIPGTEALEGAPVGNAAPRERSNRLTRRGPRIVIPLPLLPRRRPARVSRSLPRPRRSTRLRAFVRDTQTARTPFTQTVVDKNGRTVQQSRRRVPARRDPASSAGAWTSPTGSSSSATASGCGSTTRT